MSLKVIININIKLNLAKRFRLICVLEAAPGASQGHPGTLQGHPGRPEMRSSHGAFPFEAHMEYCLPITRHHPSPLCRRYCGGCRRTSSCWRSLKNLISERRGECYSFCSGLHCDFFSRICHMLVSDSLYNVRIHIVLPTVQDCIAIPSAEDYNVIHSTKDCSMIPLFASSMLFSVLLCKCYLRSCLINMT